MFVLMMQGFSLSATLPEDIGLGERFWYWRGASGQTYIHSIYLPGHCPPVPGAVFVVARKTEGGREALRVGRFGIDGLMPAGASAPRAGEEIHVHLLTRDALASEQVLHDLQSTLESPVDPVPEQKVYRKPVQLELLAA